MPMYQYIKAKPKRRKKIPAIVSLLFIGTGAGILAWVAWPIISFTLFTEPLFAKVISPVQDIRYPDLVPPVIASNVLVANSAANKGTSVTDYTNANIWFPTNPQKKIVTPINSYMVSIPTLKIKNATTIIAGDDLNKSLIHYGGTALPGSYGNAVIFGHSTLPQFFNPTNYRTIFSTLPTIKIGDKVYVNYDSVVYTYIIYDMQVVDPNDLTALEQRFDDSYITLVTCVPPGTYLKRLLVRGRLERPAI